MNWIRARFSFQGRATRKELWLQFLGAMAMAFGGWIIGILLSCILRLIFWHYTGNAILLPAVIMTVVSVSLYAWLFLAVSVRRYHDLDRPFRFIPYGDSGIEYLFARGTIGPNRYGPDPLRKEALAE